MANKQMDKFNSKMKKAAALQAEAAKMKEDAQKSRYERAARYNMVGTEKLFEGHGTNVALNVVDLYGEKGAIDLKEKGILEEEAAAIFSHTGFATWMETMTIDRERIVAEALAPVMARLEQLEKQNNILLALAERNALPVGYDRAPSIYDEDKEQFVSFEEVFAQYAQHSRQGGFTADQGGFTADESATDTLKGGEEQVETTPITTRKKPGRKPNVFKAALLMIEQSKGQGGRVRWNEQVVGAAITIYSVNNPGASFGDPKSKDALLWNAYNYVQRTPELKGKWAELVKKYKFTSKK